jgi:nucleotide-binding universal stress UspA family protein
LNALPFAGGVLTTQENTMQEIQTIITPVDFSDNAEMIAESAAYTAGKFGAELHLIFVVQNFEDYSGFFVPPVNLPNLEEELLKSAQQRMDEFIADKEEEYLQAGVAAVHSKVLTGDVSEEILQYAKEIGCHLIVMGTHGYKGLERIMFGSVADKVVKNSCCPVLTINPYRQFCEDMEDEKK